MKRLTRLAACLCLAALATHASAARHKDSLRIRPAQSRQSQPRQQPTQPQPSPTPQQSQPQQAGALDDAKPMIRRRKDGEMMRATLTRIDCLRGSNVVFNVKAGERVLRLHAASIERVEFVSYVPSLIGAQLGCGVRKPENLVYVTFRRATAPKSKFDGELIAVDFVTPDIELEPEEKP